MRIFNYKFNRKILRLFYFNTPYVIIQQKFFHQKHQRRKDFNTSYVIIQLNYFFIVSLGFNYFNTSLLLFNDHVRENCTQVLNFNTRYVAIQLLDASLPLTFPNFNTFYVVIQRLLKHLNRHKKRYFNTFHIIIQLSQQKTLS